ncbi:hypothetical protein N9984_03170 [Akkermansiaceae bacterium]|nr:hypothetical protein [Akkermansiaceae bacterium]
MIRDQGGEFFARRGEVIAGDGEAPLASLPSASSDAAAASKQSEL